MPSANKGIVFLVGAGPGAPDLITLRGMECLKNADVVVYDYLANEQLLSSAPGHAERIYAGKIGGRHNQDQDEINRQLIASALEGKTVVRLKGGDPFIFGRGGEECEALYSAGIPFEVVPGVTAAVGAAAFSGIPLTHRDFTGSVTFITGQEGKEKDTPPEHQASGSGTLVFYMGVTSLRKNMDALLAEGRNPDTPVALVRWATTPAQQVITGTISGIADKAEAVSFKPPAVTIVGEVVKLHEKLKWYDTRPLSGKKIIVTRASEQSGELSTLLSSSGATVYECPTIRLMPPESWDSFDSAVTGLPDTDWVIFTSVNAVRFFFDRIEERGLDSRILGQCRICAVGSKTGEALRPFGIRPDLLPAVFTAEGIIETFSGIDIKGAKILYPHADLARDVIVSQLSLMGAEVTAPIAYRNVLPERLCPETLLALERRTIDCIIFTASSTAVNMSNLLGNDLFTDMLKGVAVASIGPITSSTCRDLGLKVDIQPETYTLTALTDAIKTYFYAHTDTAR